MKCRLGRQTVADVETSHKNSREIPLVHKVETADEVLGRVVQRILPITLSKSKFVRKATPTPRVRYEIHERMGKVESPEELEYGR